MEAAHEGIKPHSCKICNATFYVEPDLNHHIIKIQEGKTKHN